MAIPEELTKEAITKRGTRLDRELIDELDDEMEKKIKGKQFQVPKKRKKKPRAKTKAKWPISEDKKVEEHTVMPQEQILKPVTIEDIILEVPKEKPIDFDIESQDHNSQRTREEEKFKKTILKACKATVPQIVKVPSKKDTEMYLADIQ